MPERFTFPFYYEPHPLCVLAAEELQNYLRNQNDWEHNFGLKKNQPGLIIGKMFGVLVVKNEQNQLGYLAAFSGKLAGVNHLPGFVPPVYDMLTEDGFFFEGTKELNRLTDRIALLEKSRTFNEAKDELETTRIKSEQTILKKRTERIEAKILRKERRIKAEEELDPPAFESFNAELIREALKEKFELKQITAEWNARVKNAQANLDKLVAELDSLKKERKNLSGTIQKRLFENYQFLNGEGERKNLLDIFNAIKITPPAGSGECAAPKLLNYAFEHGLQPIAMAEFWWGSSPASEIRKHGFYYAACRGKCEPILGHMLKGLKVDENPIIATPLLKTEIEIVYEDDMLAVINKPSEFLSIPGKVIKDCVYQRMKERYPEATGPLVVHRLDMATSGIMLIAKTNESHKKLQEQFIKRTIKKRYVAVLEGLVGDDEGLIDLPLRIDLDDRPRQLVCYEYGKSAQTKWKVLERKENRTRIQFYPITGRTHQLRMHAAHEKGLNIPIVGDDLYGEKDFRLHLHADFIEFLHPMSRQVMKFEVPPEF